VRQSLGTVPLEGNNVQALMLDTKWKVIRKCATVIIMAVYRNVGIPLEFAFGAVETKELDEQYCAALMRLFAIDLSRLILESGQASALCAECKSKGQTQVDCLRHFVPSLKQNEFRCHVANLVKCRIKASSTVSNRFLRLSSGAWRNATDVNY
jgi:hypothetical protein